jgi:hypothetical protein
VAKIGSFFATRNHAWFCCGNCERFLLTDLQSKICAQNEVPKTAWVFDASKPRKETHRENGTFFAAEIRALF